MQKCERRPVRTVDYDRQKTERWIVVEGESRRGRTKERNAYHRAVKE